MSWRSLAALSLLLPVVFSAACGDKDDDDDDDDDSGYESDSDTDVDSDTDTDTPSVSVDWGGSSIDLDIDGGPGAYWFGIAQTSTGSPEDWTGEDCIYGYEIGDGEVLSYCHDAGDSGTSLTYGGNPTSLSAGTTVFPDSSFSGEVTYYLESDPDFGGDGSCFVWGQDTSYYSGLGCSEL